MKKRPIYDTVRKYLLTFCLLLGSFAISISLAQTTDCADLPTPTIEVNVNITGVDYPSSGTCGNFNVLIDIRVSNTGTVPVDHIFPIMNLLNDFGPVFENLVSGPTPLENTISAESLNGNFTGEGDNTYLIDDESVRLDQNEFFMIRIEIEVAPDQDPLGASAKLAKVTANAQSDHSDPSLICSTSDVTDSEALGDCWKKSRVAAANDQINVTLAACTALITPDMVLENHFSDCDRGNYPEGGFYRLELVGPNGEVIAEGENVIVDDPSIFNDGRAIIRIKNVSQSCNHLWGYVQLEDKTGAVIAECPSDIYTACIEKEVQKINGTIPAFDDLNENVVNFGTYSCFIEDGSLPSCDRTYDLVPFKVDKSDVYIFELSMVDNPGLMALYRGAFDQDNPCDNMIGQSDVTIFDEAVFPTDGRLEARIRMTLTLKEGESYYLLTTHAQCEEEEEDYSYVIYSDGDGQVVGIPAETEEVCYTLLCDDVPNIINQEASLNYIPSPIFTDNCTSQTNLDIHFEDELFEQGDCGGLYILRTWTARDEAGNEEAVCEQTIHFRRPTLNDIHKPNTTVPISCDEEFPTLQNGNPHPDHTGYPYVVSAFGIHDLKSSYCNVGTNYADIARIDVCDESYKIVRQWTLVDWCQVGDQQELNNSPLNNFRQIIKIGDFNAPQIDCPTSDMDFSTGPFECTASIPLLKPQVTDVCSDDWTVAVQVLSMVSTPVYDQYGTFLHYEEEEVLLAEGSVGTYAADIPIGTHIMRYIVVDNCGNQSVKDCTFTVKDAVAPVTICNDDIQVSIGGDGISRITAVDIDEGSWDNCTKVGLKVSRSFATDECRDSYLQEALRIDFSDLEEISTAGPNDETTIYVDAETKEDTILRKKDGMFFTWWEDDIFFTCCDIDQEVTVELLALDGDGLVASYWTGDNNGSYCWMTFRVEDKIAPTCIPPPAIEMLCTELPYGFDPDDMSQLETLFDVASGTDNCSGITITELAPSSDLTCGFGTITRTFEVRDAQGKLSLNDCVQTIDILERHAYEIKFPKDGAFYCGESPMPDTAVFTELACDLLSVNVKDEFFEASGEECYKILRTYQVINWCEYDGESDPIYVGRDEDCDDVGGDEDVWVLVREDGKVYFDRDNDENNDIPAAQTKEYHCGDITNPKGHWISTDIDGSASPSRDISSNGYWQYTQIVKVFDNTVPEITISNNNPFCIIEPDKCTAEIFIPFIIQESCSHYRNYSVQVFYDEFADKNNLKDVSSRGLINRDPKYTITGEYPIGKHSFELVVSDGCGNSASATVPFEVVDCKVQSPICIHGLSLELMRTEPGEDVDGDGMEDAGAMTISALDFIASPIITDCSNPVTYSINRVGEEPSPDKVDMIVTCKDEGILPVEIYAWDQGYNPYLIQPDGTKGGPNYDLCETVLFVQDNMFSLCTGPAKVSASGLVLTEENEAVEQVDIQISGGMTDNMNTLVDGTFRFEGLSLGADYTITPNRNEDFLNGVSTFDIVLISKHILGIERLQGPYKLIAADVNRSNSISALDLIQLRKMILSIDIRFKNNTSWRFVRSSYQFSDPENPWLESFPEIMNYNDLNGDISTADFTAIKIGDVNLSAVANRFMIGGRGLSGETYVEVPLMKAKRGQRFTVPFNFEKSSLLEGAQFGLHWNVSLAELVDIEYGLVKPTHLGTQWVEEGILLTSWNHHGDVPTNASIFNLVFEAREDVDIETLFHFDPRHITPEAYNAREEILDLKLRVGQSAETGFALYQNRPNPFREKTQIRFYLPEAMKATLSVYDLNGRLLRVVSDEYQRGVQELTFGKNDLPAAGVLYYTLKAGAFTATKKMVLIE